MNLIFILIVLLIGCARIPKKDLQAKLSPPISVERSVHEGIDSGIFTHGDWPDPEWWMSFDDPQLTLLIKNVLENNPTMGAAEMRAKKAVDEAYVVRAALFPHLSAEAGVNWQHLSKEDLYRISPSVLPAVIYQLAIGLELLYDFDLWGKNKQRYAAALGQARSAAAETAQTHLMLSTAAASGYIDLQTNIQKQEVLLQILEKEKDLLALSRLNYENALIDLREVKKREAHVSSLDRDIVGNQELIDLGKNFLRTLMGISPDSDVQMLTPTAHYDQIFPLPEHLSLDLLARRPDIIARVWQVESYAHDIRAAQALFYPDLNLRALGGLGSLSWSKWWSKDSLAGSLNPAIHLPIFVGGQLRANLDARVAAFEEAVYEYNQALLQAAKDVADKISQVESATLRLEDEKAVASDEATIFELSYARERSGLNNRIEVLEREVDYLYARLKVIEINDERLKNVVDLIKALGGGFIDHSNKQKEWAEDARNAK
ncbi:MAG: efflux transporter outer membrane subunit [Chlamydiia bacterium]|nr:efflux transporter outer membrane subunit [Chlamydiia bacterium]